MAPIPDEERGIDRERSQHLAEADAVEELVGGNQPPLVHQLALHQGDDRHPATESDGADSQEQPQQPKQRHGRSFRPEPRMRPATRRAAWR